MASSPSFLPLPQSPPLLSPLAPFPCLESLSVYLPPSVHSSSHSRLFHILQYRRALYIHTRPHSPSHQKFRTILLPYPFSPSSSLGSLSQLCRCLWSRIVRLHSNAASHPLTRFLHLLRSILLSISQLSSNFGLSAVPTISSCHASCRLQLFSSLL